MRESGRAAKIGKREIAQAFSVKGADRVELKRLIAGLVEEGALERRRGPAKPKRGALPPVALVDIVSRDADGELVAVPVEWDLSLIHI